MDNERQSPPVERIPLSKQTFERVKPPSKPLLVIQYVTENVTGKTYFRFIDPKGNLQGAAQTAEEAYERAIETAKKLDMEIYEDVVHVTI